jgi:hypothetical protein
VFKGRNQCCCEKCHPNSKRPKECFVISNGFVFR